MSKQTPSANVKGGEVAKGWLQVVLVVAVLLAGFAANSLLSGGRDAAKKADQKIRVERVNVVLPRVADVPILIKETGTVQAKNVIELSPQVGGRVLKVSANLAAGGAFKAGETLFQLDSADYRAAAEKARAELSTAEANLQTEEAEAEVARREWAMINFEEPIPDLVARRPQIRQAEASVQSAKAALADAELSLSRVSYSLPFDGRVVSSTIEVGQNLTAGQSYGEVYSEGGIEISVPITADELRLIDPPVGRSARVRYRGSPFVADVIHDAKIIRADARLDSVTRLSRVTLAFTGDVSFLPGTFVNVEIEGPVIESAMLVPGSAFSEGIRVWVVEDGKLQPRHPRLYPSAFDEVVTQNFDIADGVVVTPLVEPRVGAAVDVASVTNLRDNEAH